MSSTVLEETAEDGDGRAMTEGWGDGGISFVLGFGYANEPETLDSYELRPTMADQQRAWMSEVQMESRNGWQLVTRDAWIETRKGLL